MLVGASQAPLVGLPVDGHEVLGEVGQDADGRGPAPDVRPGASVGLDGADEDEPVAGVAPGLGGTHERGVTVGEVDDALDDGAGGAGPDQPGVAPPTEEQAEPRDDHRLAGAGLAGEDGEPPVRGAARPRR